MPVRHHRPPQGRQDPLPPGNAQPPGEPRRDLREGLGRHRAAGVAREAHDAASAQGSARQRRVRGDLVGRSARDGGRMAVGDPRAQSRRARVLHRARPVAGAHRLVGAAVRHGELRRARRVLLGEHGGGRPLLDRRLVLGIRRARLGPRAVPGALGRGGRPRLEPDQAGPRQAEGPRREDRRGEPGEDRLRRDRRRMDRHPTRHGRLAGRRAHPRSARTRPRGLRVPRALHERALAGGAGAGHGRGRSVRARRRRQAAVLDARARRRARGRDRRVARGRRRARVARRPQGEAGVRAARGTIPRSVERGGSGRRALRHSRGDDPPAGRRDHPRRVRARDRAAHRLDGCVRPSA